MSSTRRASANSTFRQEKYASSPEFELGLNAVLVARRCSLLTDPQEIELVWFLQYLSHQRGGLRKVAEDILPQQSALREKMADHLRELCLNPAQSPSAVTFPHFKNLYSALLDCCHRIAQVRLDGLVKTEIGKKILDSLDYAENQKSLVLVEGNARIGKSFVTQAWCEASPGKRRYVQAPSSNDMKEFFRAVANALGFPAGYYQKAVPGFCFTVTLAFRLRG